MITEQISIFDILAEMNAAPTVAISMFDNQEYEMSPVEPWMKNLLPDGEYCISLGGMYTMVLCAARKVPKELLFCYYKVGDTVYMATGVGIDKDAEEEPEEENACDCS